MNGFSIVWLDMLAGIGETCAPRMLNLTIGQLMTAVAFCLLTQSIHPNLARATVRTAFGSSPALAMTMEIEKVPVSCCPMSIE
jgi:hypothetical protein